MSSSSVASHDTTATFYHVHPAPPPTVNALSARQKAQLRRSATKLAKMLGAAPQVVDSCTGPFKISLPLPLTSSKRMLQPTLAVSIEPSVHHAHRRSRSASERVDPDLYPLSSALRPARRRHPSTSATSKRDSTSAAVLRHRRSLSAEPDLLNTRNPTPVPTRAGAGGPRPESILSQASSCDSLFLPLSEPSFAIPSAARLRREKMARVCKILGEDVPVALVFPTEDEGGDEDDVDEKEGKGEKEEKRRSGYVRYSYVETQTRPVSVIEIGPETQTQTEMEAPLPPPKSNSKPELHIQTQTQTRPRPRRVAPPRVEKEEKKAPQPQPQQQQPKWTSPSYAHIPAYRTTCTPLEPIAEHSTRISSPSSSSSFSSFSSSSTVAAASDEDDASSACSLLTNTTSSSYRFASAASASPTLHSSPSSSPPSSLDHASTIGGADSPAPPTYGSLTTHSRREFAVYVPLQPFQRFRSAAAAASRSRSGPRSSAPRSPGSGGGSDAGAGGCAAAAEAEVKKARGVKFEMVVRPLPLPPVVDLRF